MADEIKLKAPTVEQQVVVNINGEEKLRSFADTLEKISNNKNLQKYWKTQQELINATADAYGNFSKKASQDNAKELIKVTNALKAMSGTDLSNILPDFDKISKAMAEAQKVAGNIDSAFSIKGFKEAFDSFETLKAYGVDIQNLFSHFGVSSDVGELQKNVRVLEGEVEKLTRRLTNAKNANEELRNEFDNFKSGSGFADKLDELDNLKSEMSYLREQAEETFRQFLKLNNITEDGYDRDGFYDDNRFKEYFQNIKSGYLSASDAIQQFKREYSYLLDDSFKSNNDAFGLEQLQAFSNKLDSIFRQVEETSTKINDIISNGVITKSVENLSMDSSLSDSQRSLFGNLLQDEESLKSITALFQKLIEESNKTNISSENDSLQSTIEALKQLSKLPGGDTLSLGKIMNHIAEGAKLANPEVKKLLESLKLIDSEGKIIGTHINEGTLNSGVDLNDKFAIISRNDAIENVDKLIEKEKEAQQQGILLARTLASVDIGKLHYDIQELAQGSSVHQMKNSTLQQFIDETRVLCNATDEKILKLYSDAQKLSDLGFKLDLNPSNIRYDENSGFSFIDLELRKINEEAPQTVAIMHTLTQSLMGFMGQRNRLNWDDEENFYTKDNYLYLQNMLKTYERLQQIFSSKLSTPDFNQAFSDSLQLVKTRIADIEAHFENLRTPIKDVFQGDKIDQVTTSAKELDNTLEQVNIPTDSFDEVLSKLDLAKSELGEIVKITKQSASDSEGKFHDSYTLKDKRGSTEIYGLSSNTEKGQLLRSNIVGYDAKAEAQESKRLIEENIRLNKAYYNSKKQEEAEYQRLRAKYLAEGKAQEEKYYADLKKSRESTLKSYQDQINSFDKQIPKKPIDGQRSDKFEGFVQDYKNAIEEARKYLDTLGDSLVTKEVKDEWERLIGVIKKTKEEMDAVPNAARGSDADARMKEIDKLTKYLDKNTRISKEAREQLERYLALLKSGDPSVNVKELHTAWTKVAVAEREAGREGKSFLDIFKNKIVYNYAAQLAGYYLSFMDIIRYAKQGVDAVKEFDDGLTKISYTMDMTKSKLNDLGQSVLDMASDMKTSVDDAMSVAQIYANMQTTAEEIQKLSEPTLILTNLSGFDSSTIADDIQAVNQQFDILAEDSMHIADVYDYISRNIAVDYSKGLNSMAEGLQVAGSTAKQAGLSFEQTSAIIAKAVEKTRLEGSQVGNGLKTIMTRLSKVGELSDEVDNETLSQASESLKKVGIEVYNLDGSYREFDVIMAELAGKWDKLTDAEKSNISFAIAATRQTNLLSAILSNFSDSMKLAEEATNAEGSALENQQKYMESFSGHLQSLETEAKIAWINILDSDTLKNGVDLLTGLVKIVGQLVDKFGLLGTAATIGSGILGKKGLGLTNYVTTS